MSDPSRHDGPRRRLEERTDEEAERPVAPYRAGRRELGGDPRSTALYGADHERVKETWVAARLARDPRLPEFTRALEAHARHARDAGIGVADVLQSLDAVIRPERGGQPALDWDDVREIAGRVVIRAYYRDD